MTETTPNSRYIDIPSNTLLTELRSIGSAVKNKGGDYLEGLSGKEIVFDLFPPKKSVFIRIYTSIERGHATARECGADAIRILIGAGTRKTFSNKKPRFLDATHRIYRTAPQGTTEERISAFITRLKSTIRETYKTALQFPSCPLCNSPMKLRKNKQTNQSFYGCINFPKCKGVKPAKIDK